MVDNFLETFLKTAGTILGVYTATLIVLHINDYLRREELMRQVDAEIARRNAQHSRSKTK